MTNYVVMFDGDPKPLVDAMKDVFNRHSMGRINRVHPRLGVITVHDADDAVAKEVGVLPGVLAVEPELEWGIPEELNP
mgnify:CR=1 FL=1